MSNSLAHKTKQFSWLILKIGIVFACLYFIYLKIIKNEQISAIDFWKMLVENNIISLKIIFILICFSVLNWCFEILKWQKLVNSFEQISYFEACKQSLASLTASLITPNRIGEYPAKAIFYRPLKRKRIIALNFIHNSFQLLTTIFFGFLGLLFFIIKDYLSLNIQPYYAIIVFGIFIVFGIGIILRSIPYIRIRIEKSVHFWAQISKKVKLKTLLFSALRYLIFSHQFYFLLFIFKIEIGYLEAMSSIAVMYLVASIIPILSVFDVVLKGATAVFIFSFFYVNDLQIFTISLLMWIFNFVIPAGFGSYFVLNFKPKLT